jgi:hypothetical protein
VNDCDEAVSCGSSVAFLEGNVQYSCSSAAESQQLPGAKLADNNAGLLSPSAAE